ncbi:MAG: tctC [Betaproteobacteria bacterium]|jgi:tripartite-type tricarboxylate transporter receptor subunit TctC|nr:tctC [Betaproteobacteria bacterium]
MKRSTIELEALAIALAAIVGCSAAAAQSYPARPVRLLVPSTPGGSVDTLARAIATRLSEKWSQQVVVDDRAGAAGLLPRS